jgi:hypothetical protein
VLLDAAQDYTDQPRASTLLQAARTMADALTERAIRDHAGARWRFLEHRQDPPLRPPGTSWMQGAAGIAAFLLRLTRVIQDGPGAPVVDRPDQWWAVPGAPRPPRSRWSRSCRGGYLAPAPGVEGVIDEPAFLQQPVVVGFDVQPAHADR